MKSATGKALFISLLFHLFLLGMTFYIVVQNRQPASETASLLVLGIRYNLRYRLLWCRLKPKVPHQGAA